MGWIDSRNSIDIGNRRAVKVGAGRLYDEVGGGLLFRVTTSIIRDDTVWVEFLALGWTISFESIRESGR